jgi:hypothetical protein
MNVWPIGIPYLYEVSFLNMPPSVHYHRMYECTLEHEEVYQVRRLGCAENMPRWNNSHDQGCGTVWGLHSMKWRTAWSLAEHSR